ncbi:unnamed protein product, partial [Mesorhabditis spiculigera]
MSTAQYRNFFYNNVTQHVMSVVRENADFPDEITMVTLRFVQDIFLCQLYNNMSAQMAPFFSHELMDQLNWVVNKVHEFYDGIGLDTAENGPYLQREIRKIRAGTHMNEMVARVNALVGCMGNETSASCLSLLPTKFYAVSGHDSTLFAYLAGLGAATGVSNSEYTGYASSLVTEFWIDDTDESLYFKLLFSAGADDSFHVVTRHVEGCPEGELCPFEVLERLAARIKPEPDVNSLCNIAVGLQKEQKHDDERMVFVQTMWRHGDRSPQTTFPRDPITAEMWPWGLGRLSPLGMEQAMRIGVMLKEKYVDTGYLSREYEPSELYCLSSTFDRTIITAYGVLIGLYSQAPSRSIPHSRQDEKSRWPTNFVPIPVRTIEDPREHVAHVDSPCPRWPKLWEMVTQTEEYKRFYNSERTQYVLRVILEEAAYPEGATLDSVRHMHDTFLCQLYNNMSSHMAHFYSVKFMAEMKGVVDVVRQFYDGMSESFLKFNFPISDLETAPNGQFLREEILKIRAGSHLNEMVDRMKGKMECLRNSKSSRCLELPTKFYGISAHDSTVFSNMAALGATGMTKGRYAGYASSIIFELWQNVATDTFSFKFWFSDNDLDPYHVVTRWVEGCPEAELCPFEALERLARRIKPEPDVNTLCNTLP